MLKYSDIFKFFSDGPTHLLLGNGFSVSYNSIFSYESLYEIACDNGLSPEAKKVFARLGTNNFEGVLRLLDNLEWAIQLYYDVEDKGEIIRRDTAIIKETLITSIAKSHLHDTSEVSNASKEAALFFLKPFKTVFTTNYDLLLYWINMHSEPHIFGDCFRSELDNPGSDYVVFTERLGPGNGILFLHGALHLYFQGGEIKKHCWSRTHRPLIDLIREGLDNKRYPLFVAEGTPEKKMEQINSNAYLAYALGKLGRVTNRLVIFGNTLGVSDRHIATVIADNTDIKELFVGIFGNKDSVTNQETFAACDFMKSRRNSINAKIKRPKPFEIHFYDSGTVNVWGK